MKAEKFLKLYAENETEIKSTYYLYMAMRKMKEECEQEVRDNANKKAGHGKIANYAKKIAKANTAGMPALHYAKTIDGRQYFCDGHRLLILDNPIAFEECPHDMKFPDYEKLYWDTYYGCDKEIEYTEEEQLNWIETYSVARAEDKKGRLALSLPIDGKMYLLNADYVIEFLKCGFCKVRRDISNSLYPALFENENGDKLIVLPIKPTNEDAYGIYNLDTGKYYG